MAAKQKHPHSPDDHEHRHDHAHDGHEHSQGHDRTHDHGSDNQRGSTHDGHEHSHQGHEQTHDHASGAHHGHDHAHGHGHHHGPGGHHHHGGNKRGLTLALLITGSILLLEFIGGLLTGSLALLSDSAHMLSDAASLLLSLGAFWIAARPASAVKTYGFHRFEILAALFNGIALFGVSGWIIWEAIERLQAPPQVQSGAMIGIAVIGLVANLLSALSLMKQGDVHGNMNMRSAYLHVLSDALGSVGAIAAGIVMYFFGWYVADPIISMIVAVLVLKSAWGVLSHSVHILMEGTPSGIEHAQVKEALEQIPGVRDVHDLHIWVITSGMNSLSCHLLIGGERDSQTILQEAIERLEQRFQIRHATIQVETTTIRHGELH